MKKAIAIAFCLMITVIGWAKGVNPYRSRIDLGGKWGVWLSPASVETAAVSSVCTAGVSVSLGAVVPQAVIPSRETSITARNRFPFIAKFLSLRNIRGKSRRSYL